MSQDYPDILETRKQNLSRAELLARDDANRSNFSGATAPADPMTWQFWLDTTCGFLKQWTGSVWKIVGDRFNDDVWPEDYGYTGGNETNDLAAWTSFFAAIDGGKTGRLRAQSYNLYGGKWSCPNKFRLLGAGRHHSILLSSRNDAFPRIDVDADEAWGQGFQIRSTITSPATAHNDAANCPIRFTGDRAQLVDFHSQGRGFLVGATFQNAGSSVLDRVSAKAHANRLLYIYQAAKDVWLSNIELDGAETGVTAFSTYGLNINPGFDAATRLVANNIIVRSARFQGVAIAAQFDAYALSNIVVRGIVSGTGAGVGVLIEKANGFANQHGVISNVQAQGCDTGAFINECFFIDFSNVSTFGNVGDGLIVRKSQNCGISGGNHHANGGNGVTLNADGVTSGLARIGLVGVKAYSNTGYGFASDANCYNIRDIGCHANANTAGQFNLLGTANEATGRSVA